MQRLRLYDRQSNRIKTKSNSQRFHLIDTWSVLMSRFILFTLKIYADLQVQRNFSEISSAILRRDTFIECFTWAASRGSRWIWRPACPFLRRWSTTAARLRHVFLGPPSSRATAQNTWSDPTGPEEDRLRTSAASSAARLSGQKKSLDALIILWFDIYF